MSAHSEIVRDYVELRNYLAQSHPQPNMEFEVQFKIKNGSLLAASSLSQAGVEIAKVQPTFYRLYAPYYGTRFEHYSKNLIRYINTHFKMPSSPKEATGVILSLTYRHRKNLGIKESYEPTN